MRVRYLSVLLLMFLICSTVKAQDGYPDYNDIYVNDYASVLSSSVENDIRDLLADLRTNDDIQAVVITINSYEDYETGDSTFEEFATNLFNTWGVGDSDSDGVMILVAVADRQVRIEVGSSYENTMNRPAQGIIDEFMLPRFREGNYERGIYDGTRGVIASLTGVFPQTVAPTRIVLPTSVPYSYQPPPRVYNNNSGTVFVAGAAGVIAFSVGLVGWKRIERYRPRKCQQCNAIMVRLDEVADDAFLDAGQRTEEAMKSVDYDVWKCETCGIHQVFNYNHFSAHSACPQCNYRTVTASARVVVSPSYQSDGLREVTHTCRHCHYSETFQKSIPRKTQRMEGHNSSSRSSSFGSSSFGSSSRSSFGSSSFGSSSRSSSSSSRKGGFGGGKSSGGGASGNW